MSRETAVAALHSLTNEEADLLNNSPDLLVKFQQKHGLNQPQVSTDIPVPNPQQFINQAAPSNMLKLAGVATANAPGIAGMVLNSLPGGNPSQIMPSLQHIQRIPGQGKVALQRIASVNSGGPLADNEVLPARAGQAAGTLLEITSPNLNAPKVKPITPFTAGLSNPSTVLGGLDKANTELGAVRTTARAIDEASEASRFRKLLRIPAGQAHLAEEGKAAIEAGKDLSVTQLEGYGEAMGKMQAKGGVFANDYAQAVAKAREMLQWKAPELVEKIEKSALHYAAKGDPSKLPWIIGAINPKVAALKLATMPSVQNAAGATIGAAQTVAPKIAPLANFAKNKIQEETPIPEVKQEIKPLGKTLTREKAVEFLKKAKGNPQKADAMAKKAGYDTSKLADEE